MDFMKLRTRTRTFHSNDFTDYLKSQNFDLCRGQKKLQLYNIPCAFDIETTSFYIDESGAAIDYKTLCKRRETTKKAYLPQKAACMYIWQIAIDGVVFVGREWTEFLEACEILREVLELNENRHLILYVHNLAFEFQFIRKLFNWEKVFSADIRKPIYAITDMGIEFRCSYLLSGYSLKKLGEELQKYKVEKLTGDLDYSLLRHNKTPMTENELEYCANDVRVVCAYIQEQIEEFSTINKIPLTNTGRVRTYCRNACFYEDGKRKKKRSYKRLNYTQFIHGLNLSVDEYKQLKRAFQGGYTHASALAVPPGRLYELIHVNVWSFDFTSSYPYVMLSEQFPMSSAEFLPFIDTRTFYKSLKLYCCVFDLRLYNLKPKILQEHYLSISRCIRTENAVTDNGRISTADLIFTTVTEQDFFILKQCYTWDKMEVSNFRRYRKGYLPVDFLKAIIKLYQDKTQLKGVAGKEVEYLRSKGMLNSCYGMAVTDPAKPLIEYFDEWPETMPGVDYEKAILDYNNSSNRFLFYAWGVWVTAYARRNLWSGIIEFGTDYLYSDTDSLKVTNAEAHRDYIIHYNRQTQKKLKRMCMKTGIDYSELTPTTIKGVKKPLGVWDWDGEYQRFKTLGAKRYLVQYSDNPRNDHPGEFALTVAGVGKKSAMRYMLKLADNDPEKVFKLFNDELYIPASDTGKNTHTYIDTAQSGIMIDYTGTPGEWSAESAVHLEAADYSLSMTQNYIDYILGIKELE